MRNNNKFTFLLYIFVISIILSFFLIRYYGNKYGKIIIKYGVEEAKRVVTLIINDSLSLDKYKDIDINNILIIDKDINNNIKSIDLDVYKSNILLDKINKKISDNLINISNGDVSELDIDLRNISDIDYDNFKNGFVYKVPMGNLTGIGLLSNMGPNIPVKAITVGDVISSFNSNVKEYGINNAMIEVKANVKVNVLVNMLFSSKKIEVNVNRIILMKIIQGNIPEYYIVGSN